MKFIQELNGVRPPVGQAFVMSWLPGFPRATAVVLALSVGVLLSSAACSVTSATESTAQSETAAQAAPLLQASEFEQAEMRNLPYARLSSSQKLDLYLPPGQGPFPLVIYIHGGGFILGDKTERTVDEIRAPLLNEGYALASLNYRLTNEAPFPAQIRDIKTAVRWVRAHAVEFGLNPNEVAGWGASAGGSLAALLGTSCGIPALEGPDLGSAHQSSCIQAAVDWFGPIDLLQMDDEPISASCPKPKPAENPSLTWPSLYVGGLLQEHQAIAHAANPITYITPDDAPVLIEQGTKDCLVPPEQSQMLDDALRQVMGNGGAVLQEMQGAGHYDPAFVAPANIRFVLDFLDGHLKRPLPSAAIGPPPMAAAGTTRAAPSGTSTPSMSSLARGDFRGCGIGSCENLSVSGNGNRYVILSEAKNLFSKWPTTSTSWGIAPAPSTQASRTIWSAESITNTGSSKASGARTR